MEKKLERIQNPELSMQKQLLKTEQWQVKVGNTTFVLDGLEIVVLKEASKRGDIRIVWFKDFAINISFVESIMKIRGKHIDKIEEPVRELTPEERELNLHKLAELRSKVIKNY